MVWLDSPDEKGMRECYSQWIPSYSGRHGKIGAYPGVGAEVYDSAIVVFIISATSGV